MATKRKIYIHYGLRKRAGEQENESFYFLIEVPSTLQKIVPCWGILPTRLMTPRNGFHTLDIQTTNSIFLKQEQPCFTQVMEQS